MSERGRAWAVGITVAVLWLVVPLGLSSNFYRHLLILTGINALLVLSLDLLVGYAGLISLAHAAFWGVGAYTSAILTTRYGASFVAGLTAATVLAAAAGTAFAFLSRRLRGPYFAVTSFVVGISVNVLFNNLIELTRGPMGIPGIPPPGLKIGRWVEIGFSSPLAYFYLVSFFVIVFLLLKRRILSSRMGQALVAIREDQDLAASVGINVDRYKIGAFSVSTAVAGLAGSLYAHYLGFIGPSAFTFLRSFDLFVMDVIGGAGTLAGPLVGTVFLTVIEEAVRSFSPAVARILFGIFLILTIALLPAGIVGEWERRATRRKISLQRGLARGRGRPPVSTGPPPAVLGSKRAREPILRVESLGKRFGGFWAVSGLSLEVFPGEFLGLVGPNGAGKTTALNLISGFLTPTTGRIFYRGKEITRDPLWTRAQRGVVRTFQNTKLFSSLTVWENIAIACHGLPRAEARRRVDEVLEVLGLAGESWRPASELPYGKQRLLEVAVAMAGHPSVLLLDEPLAGMNPSEAQECLALVRRLVAAGTTVILIEHNMRAVMSNCTRILVLHHGKKLAEGSPSEIQQHPEVIRAYLGTGLRVV